MRLLEKFKGNAQLGCCQSWQMRNYSIFYANLPGDITRYYVNEHPRSTLWTFDVEFG